MIRVESLTTVTSGTSAEPVFETISVRRWSGTQLDARVRGDDGRLVVVDVVEFVLGSFGSLERLDPPWSSTTSATSSSGSGSSSSWSTTIAPPTLNATTARTTTSIPISGPFERPIPIPGISERAI
ncbi:hypothetical protein D8S78_07040 [Natrialba swarupiae]|nr:hypothetical protein [Natrialba swarupiae]